MLYFACIINSLILVFFQKMWSVVDEEVLINLVRDYPWLYNKLHPSYKDAIKKQNSWEEIAKQISATMTGTVIALNAIHIASICRVTSGLFSRSDHMT